ncbi:MAG TPA: rod shape-determining protein MreC [Gaiellales bacterium]
MIGLLLAASLTLLTLSFRQGSQGGIGAIQRGALAVTAPVSQVTTRVTQPFVDAWDWTSGLIDARSQNAELKRKLAEAAAANQKLQQLQYELAQDDSLIKFTEDSKIASQYDYVGASVIRQVPNAYSQTITIDVGSSQGVAVDDPVVAPAGDSDQFAGLIGRVTAVTPGAANVQLILDADTAVSARVQGGTVHGLAMPSDGDPGVLSLKMVPQEEQVSTGQVVVTAGLQSGRLQSLLPAGIPIGQITSVSQDENFPDKSIQVTPFVDFGSLDRVLVLKVQGS